MPETLSDAATTTTMKCSLCIKQVNVKEASALNPGIPPSSLMSFLRLKPSIAGAVISEFDTAFTNSYYEGQFDSEDNIVATAVAATAVVSAQALHSLAMGSAAELEPLKV